MNTRSLIGAVEDPGLATSPESPVASLVDRPAVGIEAWATLAEAARLMRLEGVSSVLVNGGSAIATERDISRAIGAGASVDERIITVATPRPLMVQSSMSVAECAGIMLNEAIRHLVVSMPNGSTGVVSLRELAAVLLRYTDVGGAIPRRGTRRPPSEMWLG